MEHSKNGGVLWCFWLWLLLCFWLCFWLCCMEHSKNGSVLLWCFVVYCVLEHSKHVILNHSRSLCVVQWMLSHMDYSLQHHGKLDEHTTHGVFELMVVIVVTFENIRPV